MSENQTTSGPNLPLIIGGAVVVVALAVGAYFALNLGGGSGGDASMASGAGQAGGGDDVPAYLAKTEEFGTDGGAGTGVYALDHVEGDPNAPVTIIEYASWTCPACRSFHANEYNNAIKPAIEAGTAKIIVRELLRNNIDFRVALAARCEGIDFVAASDSLFPNQPSYSVNGMEQVDAGIIRALAGQGMTPAKYAECLTNTDQASFIKDVSDEASAMGVNSTPTVFVNGRRITSADRQDLAAYIERQAERAGN